MEDIVPDLQGVTISSRNRLRDNLGERGSGGDDRYPRSGNNSSMCPRMGAGGWEGDEVKLGGGQRRWEDVGGT